MGLAYRDMSVPYTDAEIEIVALSFQNLPTYNPENGGSVSSDFMKEVMDLFGFERSPDQIEIYRRYWIQHFEGRILWEGVLSIMKNIYQRDVWFDTYARLVDKDNSGFISEDEFDEFLEIIRLHDPVGTVGLELTFEDFVKEADYNKDGKVSLEEAGKYLRQRFGDKIQRCSVTKS